jgi:tetratricopeptide (TPR) repeat protein
MGLLGKLFGKRQEPTPAPSDRPETITAYDEYGRELQIEREVWRTEVLPLELRKNWSDPDALYASIGMALNDGFAADVLAAAKRFQEIDPDAERGACMHAAVLLENKRTAEAERVLRRALETFPRSAPLLANLARVHDQKGEKQKTQQVLWQAITADPNYEHALLWYTAIHHEREGEFGWIDAMQRIAAIEGSWRAKIWIARGHLEHKNLPAALELYQKVLVMAADANGVLMQISGDLGKAGHTAEIIDLVLPFYDPARHDIAAGFNFLQAFLDRGDWQRGEELLHKLMLLDLAPFRERLMWYSTQFAQLEQSPPAPQKFEGIEIGMMRLDQPIWTTGLGGPSWLYPKSSGPDIAVLAFANTTERSGLLREDEALVGAEDEIGRLTRAIPLYLTDVLRFRTGMRPATLLPVVAGVGMMVTGRESEADDIRSLCKGSAVAVSGAVSAHGESIQVDVSIWKTGEERPLARFSETGTPEQLSAVCHRLESAVLQLLAFESLTAVREEEPRFTVPADLFRHYLDGLGQAYALAVSTNLGLKSLFGERNIHRWLLTLALALPEHPVPAIALVSALANSRRGGSNLHREMEKEVLTLLEKAAPRSELHRLSPMVFRLFDRGEDFERRRGELLHGAGDDYVRWLADLETAFTEREAAR